MKNKLLALMAIVMTIITSCYDDTDIRNQLSEQKERIDKLELMCNKLNTSITSIQSIIDALNNCEYITSSAPIMEGDKEIGHTIVFSSGKTITIYHGKDGISAPQINIKKGDDGIYYWTLDGEWITDENGNKIATHGKDATTPILKIEEGYWYVSYDNGETWNKLDKASGQTEGIFEKVDSDEDSVTFTLTNGTTLTVPKASSFNVIFDIEDNILAAKGEVITIPFSVVGATGNVSVECLTPNTDLLVAKASMISDTQGKITINVKGYAQDIEAKVIVFISNGNDQVIMRSLTLTEKQIILIESVYKLDEDGGDVEVRVQTNVDYQIKIPADQSWISLVETKSFRTDVLNFRVEPLSSGIRSADIVLESTDGSTSQVFTIIQTHSMSDVCGTYEGNGYLYFDQTHSNWTAEFINDPNDESKIWIRAFSPMFNYDNTLVYGIVSEDHNVIKIPVGQILEEYSDICLYAVNLNEGYIYDESTVPYIILERKSADHPYVSSDYGWTFYSLTQGGNYEVVAEGASFTRVL